MMIFYEDTNVVRLIPVWIASYSISLLDAGKFSHIACSIISPIGALSCRLTLAPVCREATSTLGIHQPVVPRSASCWGISAKKYANICPFNAKWGLYWILNSLSSIGHQTILSNRPGLCIVLRKGRLVSTMIGCAWK